jgi:hypothetical protein
LGCGQLSVGGEVTNRVTTIKEPCYQRQCGAVGVDSSTWCKWCSERGVCAPAACCAPRAAAAPPSAPRSCCCREASGSVCSQPGWPAACRSPAGAPWRAVVSVRCCSTGSHRRSNACCTHDVDPRPACAAGFTARLGAQARQRLRSISARCLASLTCREADAEPEGGGVLDAVLGRAGCTSACDASRGPSEPHTPISTVQPRSTGDSSHSSLTPLQPRGRV